MKKDTMYVALDDRKNSLGAGILGVSLIMITGIAPS
jgi:hypothetical protein